MSTSARSSSPPQNFASHTAAKGPERRSCRPTSSLSLFLQIVPPIASVTPIRLQSIRRPPVETSLGRQHICAVDDVRSEAARESDHFTFAAAREVGEHKQRGTETDTTPRIARSQPP